MSKSRRISPFLATVKTAQWCKRFLNEIESIDGFNRHKGLLVYDADKGVVRAKNSNVELIEHYRKTVIEALGVVKQNGCPFAMSMGTSGNALIEVFQYFDEIMLHVLRHSLDFKRVFR